jgi:dGTPase
VTDRPDITILTREAAEAEEHRRLSPRAAFSDASRGRVRPMTPDVLRTDFQRDRDRIIHSKAFRRLMHKTQVFLSPEGDHYRTRLTHTLEVAQIARSIARALRLNEDLAEAISLGHDLGHTPFGHIGEQALSECLVKVKPRYPDLDAPYHHNVQSLRIVECLEYEGAGLNLTWEVRDGILHHTGPVKASTLEGQIVAIADRIAYINHDIDDAIRAGVLAETDLPAAPVAVLGRHHGTRIATMIRDMVSASAGADEIRMSPAVWDAMIELRSWLFDNIYENPEAKVDEPAAHELVCGLFFYYMEHPEALPHEVRPGSDGELPQRVTDYIAGMTDRFAIRTWENISGELSAFSLGERR